MAALRSLRGFAGWETGLGAEWLKHVSNLLPDSLEIELHGVFIGVFKPHEPLNWAGKAAGLPWGNLVTDKLALLRAALKGDSYTGRAGVGCGGGSSLGFVFRY